MLGVDLRFGSELRGGLERTVEDCRRLQRSGPDFSISCGRNALRLIVGTEPTSMVSMPKSCTVPVMVPMSRPACSDQFASWRSEAGEACTKNLRVSRRRKPLKIRAWQHTKIACTYTGIN
jgi:hypothetical protein